MKDIGYIYQDGYGGIILRNGYVNYLSQNYDKVLLI